jgi:hypothetical protein
MAMEIIIPDQEPDKSRYYKIQSVIYALELFNHNRHKAHKYLGISIRTLRNWIRDYPELHKYKNKVNGSHGNKRWQQYDNGDKWKTKKI